MAEVFNTKNGLVCDNLLDLNWDDSGSKEERAFRFWINSLGMEDVFVDNLYTDCNDGIVILKVCDKIKPGSVDWKKVCKKNKMGPFDHKFNCDLAFEAAGSIIGKTVGIAGTDIHKSNKQAVLAIVWRLCRFHYLEILGSKEEKDILEWANSRCGDHPPITGFGDKSLKSGVYLIKVAASIKPAAVNWDLVTEGIEEDD